MSHSRHDGGELSGNATSDHDPRSSSTSSTSIASSSARTRDDYALACAALPGRTQIFARPLRAYTSENRLMEESGNNCHTGRWTLHAGHFPPLGDKRTPNARIEPGS